MNQMFDDCLKTLADHARSADADSVWPAASWSALQTAGVLAWGVEPAFGGVGLGAIELLTGFERIAGAF